MIDKGVRPLRGLSAKYEIAEEEALRFLKKCEALRKRINELPEEHPDWWPLKERAAVKRSSLDLSRALSDLRKS